jgi:hypothetical protein
MGNTLAFSGSGNFAIVGTQPFDLQGRSSFDPSSVDSFAAEINSLVDSLQGVPTSGGSIGEINVFGPTTLQFTVAPVGSGATTAPGTLYVYIVEAFTLLASYTARASPAPTPPLQS